MYRCQHEECNKRAVVNGFCRKHWEEVRYEGEDANVPEENTGQFAF